MQSVEGVSMKSIAILMPTKNSVNWLDEVLTPIKLQESKYDIKLVLVDGNSRDETVEKAKTYFPDLIVRYDTSKNLAHARNIALDEARKLGVDYMAFIDSDVVVPNDFFQRMIEHLKNPKVAIVGLRFELERNPPKGFVGKYYRQRTDIVRNGVFKTDYTTTACSMWRAEIVKGIVIDERLKRAGEDVDFNLKLRESGRDLIAVIDANDPPAWHIRPSTIREELHRVKDHGLARALLIHTHRQSFRPIQYKKTLLAGLLTLLGWIGLICLPLLGRYAILGLVPFGGIFFRQWTKTKKKWRLDFTFFGFFMFVIYFTRFLQGVIVWRR